MRPDFDTMIKWIQVEAPDEEELEGMKLLEEGDLEIYGEKINQLLSEAYIVMERIGIGMMIRSGDCVVGLYTANGDLVNCSTGVLLHAIWPQVVLKWIVENYVKNPASNVKPREGDVYYCNEPLYGGVHPPDQTAIMPIFSNGELLGWALSSVHTAETGAVTPGGMPLSAKNRFYEGMRLPPVKIGENYSLRDDMLELFLNYMMRAPREAINDIRARVAGCNRLESKIKEFAAEKGNLFTKGLMRRMINLGEEVARKRVESWNDGVYRAVAFLDHVGLEESLLRCFVTARKEGNTVTFDFTGTSPEHDAGSYLTFPHVAVGGTASYILQYAFHDLPIGTAAYSQFRWHIPQGCIFNAGPMAPTSRGTSLTFILLAAFHEIFAKILFDSEQRDQIIAPTGAGSSMNISGITQDGIRVSDMLSYVFNTEGLGARYELDGCNSNATAFTPASRGYDAEVTESEMPLLHLYQKHRKDSCGFGRIRGGSGVEAAYVCFGVPEISFFSGGRETHIRACQGLFGGYPGTGKLGIEVHDTDVLERLAKKDPDIPSSTVDLLERRKIKGDYVITHNTREYHKVKRGDIVVHMNAGGAGYGDVLLREPDSVVEDVRNEIVSHWAAENVFKVVYDREKLIVDYERTEQERQKEREQRKERGKSYDEFEKEWLKRRPLEQAIKYFGSWPEGKQTRKITRV
jgi:acetophenone carboxylase